MGILPMNYSYIHMSVSLSENGVHPNIGCCNGQHDHHTVDGMGYTSFKQTHIILSG